MIVAGEGRWGCRRQGIGQKGSQSLLDNHSVHLFSFWYPHWSSVSRSNLFPSSIWYPSWQVQHDICGDKRQGQHRGGTSNHPHLPTNESHLIICILHQTYLQAFLELVDRVLQSPGIWSPGQALASVAPSHARPPILGWEQTSKCKLEFFSSSGLNKEEPQVPRLAVEPK